MTDLANLIALAESATPSEWSTSRCSNGGKFLHRAGGQSLQIVPSEDAEYIAALSPSVALSLMRELAAARKVLTWIEAEAEANAMDDCCADGFQTIALKCHEHSASTTKTEAEGKL